MSDSNVIKLAQPGAFSDSLTEILRSGARALLTQAIVLSPPPSARRISHDNAPSPTGTVGSKVVETGTASYVPRANPCRVCAPAVSQASATVPS